MHYDCVLNIKEMMEKIMIEMIRVTVIKARLRQFGYVQRRDSVGYIGRRRCC